MTRSGSWSPTLTELNSRSAIVKTLISVAATPRKGGVGLLYYFAVLIGHDVLGHDDVGAERVPHRVNVHVAIEAITGLDGPDELQFLVDLDDLGVLNADVGRG